MTNNGYTQKELLNMVIERLDRLEEKLDAKLDKAEFYNCLLYTSPSPRDLSTSRMPSSA